MVYESGNKSYLDVLLTATSMTDMLNKTEYVSCVSLYDYNILKEHHFFMNTFNNYILEIGLYIYNLLD